MISIISAITGQINGLKNFITEVLECQSKAQEVARVKKELANIANKFNGKGMTGYSRKKYVAKLLYIYLLGYSFDFGFPEMMELLSSSVFSEKQIGYITLGVFLNGNYELVTMLIEHFRKEIRNTENEPAQCLALAAAANIGGKDIAETLSGTMLQALQNPKNSNNVKKLACLALCRLYRESPAVIVVDPTLVESLSQLLFTSNLGVQLSAATFIHVLIPKNADAMKGVYSTVLMQLQRVFFDTIMPQEYIYGRNPVPWLILKYLRILQHKQEWDETEVDKITRILDVCLQKTDTSLPVKEVNTNMMLLFESINFIIARKFSEDLLKKTASILGGFLSAQQSNLRYVSLETLTRLVQTQPDIIPTLDQHRQTLYLALRDQDNSIRRRALSLLFAVCTKESAEEIVHELLNYLRFADITMREPLCLKIAVMAEQFAEDPAWFVDVVLQLITLAGDQCNDTVWYRVVQVVSSNPSLQRYATITSFQSMQVASPHDRLICLASQLVGEYIQSIEIPPDTVIDELIAKFRIASDNAKGIILSALAKIGAKFPAGRQKVGQFLVSQRSSTQLDIQQRAIEYTAILSSAPDLIASVFKPIPPFEKKVSSLHQLVREEDDDGAGETEEDEADDGEQFVTKMPPRQAQPMPTIEGQQQQAAPAQPRNAADELLGDLMVGPSNPPAAAAKPVSNIDDLLGPSAAAPGAGNNALELLNAAPVKQVDSKEACRKRFLSSDSGLCYEDENAAINLSITMNGPNAILSFNIQNKTVGVLTGVNVHIPPCPSIKIQSRPGAQQINRGEMTVYQFAVMVSQPYIDPPSYTFRYKWNEQLHNELLDLPLPIFKFVAPFNMDHPTFFQRWGRIVAPNQIAQAQFQPQGDPIQQMKTIMTSVFKSPVLQLQVPPNNVCGAGVINTEAGVFGILNRFYFENGQIFVQIKGTTPQITAAVQKVLDQLFK
jgi:AP-2 complex subunit alpha